MIDIRVNSSLQNFYVKIKHEADEFIYECQKAKSYSTHATCTGKAVPVGEMLSFFIISQDANTTLAAGSFPIIGLALATPEVRLTPTPVIFDHSPR